MKNHRLLVFGIFLLTLLGLLVVLPEKLSVNFTLPKLLSSGKEVKIVRTIPLVNANTFLRMVKRERDLTFRKGLDLEGGTSITLKADMKDVPSGQEESALDSARQVIERRVNFFGVSEPVIQTSKSGDEYRIIVEIPGVTDVNKAVSLIGTTAKLTFWEEGASRSAALKVEEPTFSEIFFPERYAKKTNLSGSDLQQAQVSFDQTSGSPVILLQFNAEGAKKFADITKRNVGKRLGFSLDDIMIDAPGVSSVIPDGNGQITGLTLDQAKRLQVQLNAGALPVSLSVLEQHAVGATLGQSSLEKSLIAGIIGFAVIAIFMIALYGRLGFIATWALLLYTIFVLAIFKLIPVTLTLAGIAGFILSIGIAVDANILIFERVKEELRRGKTRETAIELGFSRAWSSIRDSNVASLITSAILMYFGTGIIRGFALTLAIGVIVSMFSAIVVTRSFLRLAYRSKRYG